MDIDYHNSYIVSRCYRDFAAGKDISGIYYELSRDKIYA